MRLLVDVVDDLVDESIFKFVCVGVFIECLYDVCVACVMMCVTTQGQ